MSFTPKFVLNHTGLLGGNTQPTVGSFDFNRSGLNLPLGQELASQTNPIKIRTSQSLRTAFNMAKQKPANDVADSNQRPFVVPSLWQQVHTETTTHGVITRKGFGLSKSNGDKGISGGQNSDSHGNTEKSFIKQKADEHYRTILGEHFAGIYVSTRQKIIFVVYKKETPKDKLDNITSNTLDAFPSYAVEVEEEVFYKTTQDELSSNLIPVDFEVVSQGNYGSSMFAGLELITKQEGLGDLKLSRQIDFANEDVLVYSLGSRNTGGFSVSISKVVQENDKVIVYYQERKPTPGFIVTQAFTKPFVVFTLPKSDLPIEAKEDPDFLKEQAALIQRRYK